MAARIGERALTGAEKQARYRERVLTAVQQAQAEVDRLVDEHLLRVAELAAAVGRGEGDVGAATACVQATAGNVREAAKALSSAQLKAAFSGRPAKRRRRGR